MLCRMLNVAWWNISCLFWERSCGRVAFQPAVLAWWWASIVTSTCIDFAIMVPCFSSGGISKRMWWEGGGNLCVLISPMCALAESALVAVVSPLDVVNSEMCIYIKPSRAAQLWCCIIEMLSMFLWGYPHSWYHECTCTLAFDVALPRKSVWTGITVVTALITESLRTLMWNSLLFPLRLLKKHKAFMVKFTHLGRACQVLCGFASLPEFFVPAVRGAEGLGYAPNEF